MIVRFFVISGRSLQLLLFWFRTRKREDFHEQFAMKIRKTFENLGPTFIKLGQMLSMRPDYIPHVYCRELEELLDRAPRVPATTIRGRIEKELKKPISNLFQKFDNVPVASASLSQVHKAILWDDTVVAVKVLRPGVEKIIRTDTRLLRIFLPLVGKYISNIPKPYWIGLVNQLTKWLLEETNYELERRNMDIMRREMCEGTDIFIPKVHDEFCSKGVLTMDFVNGWSLSELIRLKEKGELPEFAFDLQERIMYLGDKIAIASVGNGYFHGDIHPANIFLTPEGKIGVIDFGLIQYFDVRMRNNVTLFMIGATFANPELIIKSAYKLGIYPDDFDEKKIFMRLSEICDVYRDAPTEKMSNGQFVIQNINIFLEAGLQLPWSVILYARTTLGFDGIILKLCPEYVFAKRSRGLFLETYMRNVLEAHCSIPKFVSILDDFVESIENIPPGMRKIFETLAKRYR